MVYIVYFFSTLFIIEKLSLLLTQFFTHWSGTFKHLLSLHTQCCRELPGAKSGNARLVDCSERCGKGKMTVESHALWEMHCSTLILCIYEDSHEGFKISPFNKWWTLWLVEMNTGTGTGTGTCRDDLYSDWCLYQRLVQRLVLLLVLTPETTADTGSHTGTCTDTGTGVGRYGLTVHTPVVEMLLLVGL